MKFTTALISGVALGLALVLIALAALPLEGAIAAPAAAPTPISAPGSAGTPSYVTFWGSTALVTSTRSNPLELGAYNRLDLQYTIDQGTVNTATLYLQTSCDGQNWDSGVAFVSNNAADATGVVSLPNFCRYTAISSTLSNTNPLTVIVKAAAKQ